MVEYNLKRERERERERERDWLAVEEDGLAVVFYQ